MTWFDATQVDPATGQSFPLGNHRVVIKDSMKQAVKDKPNDGMLIFTLEIIEGANKGFAGPYRLNLWNSNPQAAEIAGRQLSALCHVLGTYKLENPQKLGAELFMKPFRILVTPQKNDDKYTEISAVLDDAGNPPVKGGLAPTQQAPQQAPQQAASPSWQPQQQGPGGAPSWAVPTQAPTQPNAAPAWSQQPQQQGPGGAPSWAVPTQAPTQPNAAPAWSQQPQQQGPGGAPSWAVPTQAPTQPNAAPAWSQQPQQSGPSWGLR